MGWQERLRLRYACRPLRAATHADRYGRPFEYRTDDGQAVPGVVPVPPNGYGLGVGMDQYDRPVRAIDPATGQTLPAGSIDTDGE